MIGAVFNIILRIQVFFNIFLRSHRYIEKDLPLKIAQLVNLRRCIYTFTDLVKHLKIKKDFPYQFVCVRFVSVASIH